MSKRFSVEITVSRVWVIDIEADSQADAEAVALEMPPYEIESSGCPQSSSTDHAVATEVEAPT